MNLSFAAITFIPIVESEQQLRTVMGFTALVRQCVHLRKRLQHCTNSRPPIALLKFVPCAFKWHHSSQKYRNASSCRITFDHCCKMKDCILFGTEALIANSSKVSVKSSLLISTDLKK
ncbi:hypothetical protein T4B_8915 [Trichinella pseudospiralis]|uniref:Uncharacterized protein n=2 Tax=Trichinella pseudospiralis TaxID=6337 RepID=A0A0V1FA27_TRIPS|nr:hypothetical protein T4A_13587 [Trichinella pseudospiralis]KRY82928.1 hypothetical protein T4D_2243 [Trichinella pseudospiralis]KRZ20759.1 hypothetical protein T4B_8915 [Trichinella pseudospiralis]KRZ38312.1 hypothetical protein T4C_382 [Trichinella pseudospiralis]